MTQTKKKRKLNGDSGAKPHAAYFLSLTVENVRCFGPAQTLDLSDGNGRPARWTIILGDNGTGKTTLLQALVAMLPRVVNKEGTDVYFIPEMPPATALFWGWQRVASGSSKVNSYLIDLDEVFCKSEAEFWSGINLLQGESGLTSHYLYDLDGVSRQCSLIQKGKLGSLVSFSYGASRRMGKTALSEKVEQDIHASLFDDNVSLLNAEEWLLEIDYTARIPSEIQQKAKVRRELVRTILIDLLPDVTDVRIALLSNEQPKPRVEFKTLDGWIGIQGVSLGYKTLTAWMVDFASRMFDAYPDSETPLAEPAVVLVDEIDLHLHPRWQRDLISRLTELFPNTQFIVTTHSPLVVQAAADANLVVLRREGDHVVIDNDVEAVRGWRADQILTSELFDLPNARPPQFDEWLKERGALLAKSKLTKKDRARLLELEVQIGSLPVADNPLEDKAMDLIMRAAARLEKEASLTTP